MFVCFKYRFIFVSNIIKMKKTKQAIAPTLKKLTKNEKTEFPVSRYSVVSATCQRLLINIGVRYTVKKFDKVIEVTRVN